MIRLVTQFDATETRATSATPTCSCSSCCCSSCCVGTAAASMAYTGLSVHYLGKAEAVASSRRWAAVALGVLALPVASGLGLVIAGEQSAAAGVTLFFAAWLALVTAAYRLVRAGTWLGRSLLVVAVAACFGGVEFAAGVAAEASVGYLVVELVAAAVAIALAWTAAKRQA